MRTFLDAGVLIAAFRGSPDARRSALAAIEDPTRIFVVSDFVRLEVLPKAQYYKRQHEVAFYTTIIATAESVEFSPNLIESAHREAAQSGLAAMDALHVAAAKDANCEELLTTENPEKPMFRASGIRVISIS